MANSKNTANVPTCLDTEEKWVDKAEFVCNGSPEQVHRMADALADGLQDYLESERWELDKRPEETELINDLVSAHNQTRRVLKVDEVRFSPDRVHLFRPEDWPAVTRGHVEADCKGLYVLGHCYLVRSELADMVARLSHEMMHALAFQGIIVELTDKHGITLDVSRSGLARTSESAGQGFDYVGLHEAAIDLLSINLRKAMVKRSQVLTPEKFIRSSKTICYLPQAYLVSNLCRDLAKAGGGEPNRWLFVLYRDLLVGTDCFLDELERVRPEAIPVLRDLNDDFAAAISALRQLGYDSSADYAEKRLSASNAAGDETED